MPKDWTDFTPRANPPKEKPVETAAIALTDSEITARLDAMTVDELKALVRRANAVLDGVLLATVEERMEAAKIKLWRSGLTEREIHKALPALNAAMDREIGKPAQSIAMTVKDEGLSKVSTDKLLRLAAMLDEPLILPPMPSKPL